MLNSTAADTTPILAPDQRGYADASILVTTDWLAERIDSPGIQVVDTDTPDLFGAGHIPGSSNPPDNYYKTSLEERTHIQGPAQFAETMQALGIGDNTTVVAYDRTGGLYALRLMWALHFYGHRDVKMLDGGYQKWVAEGRATSTEPFAASGTRSFTPRKPDTTIYANQADVKPQSTILTRRCWMSGQTRSGMAQTSAAVSVAGASRAQCISNGSTSTPAATYQR